MAPNAHSKSGRPLRGAKFFKGMPWEPPLAKIRPATWGLGLDMFDLAFDSIVGGLSERPQQTGGFCRRNLGAHIVREE